MMTSCRVEMDIEVTKWFVVSFQRLNNMMGNGCNFSMYTCMGSKCEWCHHILYNKKHFTCIFQEGLLTTNTKALRTMYVFSKQLFHKKNIFHKKHLIGQFWNKTRRCHFNKLVKKAPKVLFKRCKEKIIFSSHFDWFPPNYLCNAANAKHSITF